MRPLFLVLLLSFLQLLRPPPRCHGADLPGHMQPLGSHRPPESVPRLSHVPLAEEFHENWEKAGQPVVLEGLLKGTEVLRNWQQDDYLRAQFGEDKLHVEQGKKENSSGAVYFISMAEFLDRYLKEDIYMVSDMPEAMRKEWPLPKFLLCGGYTQHLMFVYLWFSSGGTRSILHSDSYENLHCLVSGRKEFLLIEPKYTETIGPELQEFGFYPIDVDSVNMTARPGLAEVPWHKAIVNEGDCLYLPYNWIHQVRSYNRNFGVNVWWMQFKFNSEECSPSHIIPDFAPVGDFLVLAELQIKYVLQDLARDDGTVHVEDLYHAMNENSSVPWVSLQNVREVFEMIDPGCGDVLNSKKIDSTPYEAYKKAHDYIMAINAGEEQVDNPGEESHPFDADYLYFDGDLDEAKDYDFEDPEHSTEGGRHSRVPSQPRDEL